MIKKNKFLMRKLVFLLTLALFSTLTGFSSIFYVNVFQENKNCQKFTFERSFFRNAELNQFTVLKKTSEGWDYKHPLWRIYLEAGHAIRVDVLTYGITPTDFISDQPAQTLEPGEVYLARASAPGMTGSSPFTALELGECLAKTNN
jgi:hypothetical protein